MKLSVLIITYNHERFIAQAIESVLMQVVDFDYEIVIGEDCSTDSTRDIIKAFQAKYPEKIRPVFHEKNLGLKGARNLFTTLKACQGDYIALLDGDDYWTSPHKLQKQVSFLDNHPDYVMCFHSAVMFYDDGSKEPQNYRLEGETFRFEDLLETQFILTCSVMFRNVLPREYPDWVYASILGDWPLYILIAQHGKVRNMHEIMGAYRMHSGGVWFFLDDFEKIQENLKLFELLTEHFHGKHKNIINKNRADFTYALAVRYNESGDPAMAREYAIRSLAISSLGYLLLSDRLLKLLMIIIVPGLHSLLKKLKYILLVRQ